MSASPDSKLSQAHRSSHSTCLPQGHIARILYACCSAGGRICQPKWPPMCRGFLRMSRTASDWAESGWVLLLSLLLRNRLAQRDCLLATRLPPQ
mmetsp:Transcript_25136/g.46621  ORF Transcript_25136/g.46621 Transcript_25136/m.46621 type:complete len:94 (+) Transcript_25136:133-414(+)